MALLLDAKTLRTVVDARAAFEAGAYDDSIAAAAYQAFASVPDIDLFLKRARVLFPALNCGLCSAYLRSVLGRGSIVGTRYDNHPHTVLAVDGVIIDITADQFGGPRIYVGVAKPPWSTSPQLDPTYVAITAAGCCPTPGRTDAPPPARR